MTYVLDTNIIVAALNGQRTVVDRLNSVSAGEAVLPAMVLAELRYGALSSRRIAENMARIDRLLDILLFVPAGREVVERFGAIKADLRRQGAIKSDADLLIAATAVEFDGVLVSDDQAFHDGSIARLQVENWL